MDGCLNPPSEAADEKSDRATPRYPRRFKQRIVEVERAGCANEGGTAEENLFRPLDERGFVFLYIDILRRGQLMLKYQTIGFIGAGSIAESIIAGLLEQEETLRSNISLMNRSDRERIQFLTEKFGLDENNHSPMNVFASDIIILAFKPQNAATVLRAWKAYFRPDQLVITLCAGISTSMIEQMIGIEVAVVRAMPNTSCAVGLSATAICKGTWAKEKHLALAEQIFTAIGTVSVVEEQLMDAVTGLSGSGPAYFYYMVEALETAGIQVGLTPETARKLIVQTILGAAHMLAESGKRASELQVTSPGGTTMAGIGVLDQYHFREAVTQAVLKATARSKELGEQLVNMKGEMK
jgi:pyrroline-5-carboxylate reductase